MDTSIKDDNHIGTHIALQGFILNGGDSLIPPAFGFLLQENGDYLLQESGDRIILP